MDFNLVVVLVAVIALAVWYFFLRKASAFATKSDVLKDIVGALLAALCPVLYSLFIDKYPSFADVIDAKSFTALITWVIYAVFWGGALYNVIKAASFKAFQRYAQFK
jgi:drug/metabolite transporter (DMT)-like permease